jgi:hypothetical protein
LNEFSEAIRPTSDLSFVVAVHTSTRLRQLSKGPPMEAVSITTEI